MNEYTFTIIVKGYGNDEERGWNDALLSLRDYLKNGLIKAEFVEVIDVKDMDDKSYAAVFGWEL